VSALGITLVYILTIFLVLLVARMVMDYVFMFARSYQPKGPAVMALEVLYSCTDPPVKFLRCGKRSRTAVAAREPGSIN